MVGLFQVNVVVGVLLAYLSNYVITTRNLGSLQWRWEFGVAVLPSILFLILLYGIPRSSRWLVTTNQTDEARRVLEEAPGVVVCDANAGRTRRSGDRPGR